LHGFLLSEETLLSESLPVRRSGEAFWVRSNRGGEDPPNKDGCHLHDLPRLGFNRGVRLILGFLAGFGKKGADPLITAWNSKKP